MLSSATEVDVAEEDDVSAAAELLSEVESEAAGVLEAVEAEESVLAVEC